MSEKWSFPDFNRNTPYGKEFFNTPFISGRRPEVEPWGTPASPAAQPSFIPSSSMSTAPCCFWQNSAGCPCVPENQHSPHHPFGQGGHFSHFLVLSAHRERASRLRTDKRGLGWIRPVPLVSFPSVAVYQSFIVNDTRSLPTGVRLDVSIKVIWELEEEIVRLSLSQTAV